MTGTGPLGFPRVTSLGPLVNTQSSSTPRDYDRFARRIERLPGTVIRQRVDDVGVAHIIDFNIGFPDGPIAERDDIRVDAVEQSAVTFNSPEQVSNYRLRLPQIPVGPNPEEETKLRLERRFGRLADYSVRVVLADGERSYTPHVYPTHGATATIPSNEALDDIAAIWEAYRDLALPDGDI